MLVNAKTKNKILLSVNNLEEIEKYKLEGVFTFLLPLKGYTVGYPASFTMEKINVSAKENNVYCLINKVLNNKEIDELKVILPELNVKGFVIEDIGLIKLLKDLKKEIILFINHFNCNYKSINVWLNYVDSVFVSNELTKEELEEIDKNVVKPVVYHLFGYNQVMYSKRKLVSNYEDYYHLPYTNPLHITDKMGSVKFTLYEENNSTVGLSDKCAVLDCQNLENVYYFYVNTAFLNLDTVMAFLHGKSLENIDNGFLEKKTVFKIGDIK